MIMWLQVNGCWGKLRLAERSTWVSLWGLALLVVWWLASISKYPEQDLDKSYASLMTKLGQCSVTFTILLPPRVNGKRYGIHPLMAEWQDSRKSSETRNLVAVIFLNVQSNLSISYEVLFMRNNILSCLPNNEGASVNNRIAKNQCNFYNEVVVTVLCLHSLCKSLLMKCDKIKYKLPSYCSVLVTEYWMDVVKCSKTLDDKRFKIISH